MVRSDDEGNGEKDGVHIQKTTAIRSRCCSEMINFIQEEAGEQDQAIA